MYMTFSFLYYSQVINYVYVVVIMLTKFTQHSSEVGRAVTDDRSSQHLTCSSILTLILFTLSHHYNHNKHTCSKKEFSDLHTCCRACISDVSLCTEACVGGHTGTILTWWITHHCKLQTSIIPPYACMQYIFTMH